MNVHIKDLPRARHSEILDDALFRGAKALGQSSAYDSSFKAETMILVGLCDIITEVKEKVETLTAK